MTTKKNKETTQFDKPLKCGIVMPISKNSAYSDSHWTDVLNILVEAIEETDFVPSLVSDDPAIGLIHDRIVSNLYSNEIVVCDVSSKNPNVMFELGLRLAFDKPTIIIKDELTGFSFDTGVIEHIPYPSSLRFSEIVDFKKALITKINATYEKSKSDRSYSPFLKSFGQKIVPATINGQEITETKYILQSLNEIQHEIRVLRNISSNQNDYNDEKLQIISNTTSGFLKKNLIKFIEEYVIENGPIKSNQELENAAETFRKKYGIIVTQGKISRMLEELVLKPPFNDRSS